jgi:signal transduction histidine kinase
VLRALFGVLVLGFFVLPINPKPQIRNPQSKWVRLSVLDDGMGISEKVKARIFESFYTTKERGTGLGLTVVQQIVEAAGGRIEVRSEPGRGTRFDVLWPFAEGSRVVAPEKRCEGGATRQRV